LKGIIKLHPKKVSIACISKGMEIIVPPMVIEKKAYHFFKTIVSELFM